MRVLTALSEEGTKAACTDFLSSFGWDVESTSNAAAAERLATFREYDAVVTDLEFGGWHGEEGLDIVRAAKLRGRSPFIVVLTTSDCHAIDGANLVFQKPERLDVIAGAIDRAFQKSGIGLRK